MTIDDRLGALTQSVELLASLHKDNEKRIVESNERTDKRIAEIHARESKLRQAMLRGIAEFLRALDEGNEQNGNGDHGA